MRLPFLFAICSVYVLSAQTPNLSGVWKANLEKSKINGPAPANYLVLIDQQDGKLTEKVGVYTQRGEQRSSFTYKTDGSPSRNSYHGLAMRTTGGWESGGLVLHSKIAGTKPGSATEKFTLSPGGNTLTIDLTTSMNGRDMQQTLVMEKQPESAGEPLKQPEKTAAERFKNVQLLKDLPASQFLDAMRSFSMSLGTNCEFCHVRGKFDSDEKPTKVMARKMITMTHSINEQTFNGKMEVRCYTCHRGEKEPHSHPAFE
jgi:Photosynthetic reaction centre cytochrome C subunit